MSNSQTSEKTDLALWLKDQGAQPGLGEIILSLAEAGIAIANVANAAALDGKAGAAGQGNVLVNVQGEEQKDLDIISNDIVLDHLQKCPAAIALVSEEVPQLLLNPGGAISNDGRPNYAVCFDPLDGSSNIETNSAIGTIFSVLLLGDLAGQAPAKEQIFAASKSQIAAGYIYYGPATLLVLTIGKSVAMFALQNSFGEGNSARFLLVKDPLTIPKIASEYSINMAYQRFWDQPTTTYIKDCQSGKSGPRGKNFNMRWSGAMIADVHKLFVRGGIFIYPSLQKPGSETGKLRFLYEALPMAMLVENAGGKAIMGARDISGFLPDNLHQRVPVILGSTEEVELLRQLHQ